MRFGARAVIGAGTGAFGCAHRSETGGVMAGSVGGLWYNSGMTGTQVWIGVTVVLLACVVGLAVSLRRSRRSAAAQVIAAAHERQVLCDGYEMRMKWRDDEHAGHLAVARGRTADAEKLVTKYRASMLKAGIGWDVRSRELLLEACDALDLDGVLLTNVVLHRMETYVEPRGKDRGREVRKAKVYQIDHVLVTPQAVAVVESKGWRGIIFDSTVPAGMPLDYIVPGLESTKSFVMRLEMTGGGDGDGAEPILKVGPSAPRAQAQRHAMVLRDELKGRMEDTALPWVAAAVLYSHDQSSLTALGRTAQGSGALATAALDRAGLRRWLSELRGGSQARVDVGRICDALGGSASEVWGFGAFSDRRPSR